MTLNSSGSSLGRERARAAQDSRSWSWPRRELCAGGLIGWVLLAAGCGPGPDADIVRAAEELVAQGKLDRAYRLLERWSEEYPPAIEARQMQVWILLKGGQTEAAVRAYQDLAAKTRLPTFLNETIRHADPVIRANACFLVARIRPSNSLYLLGRAAADEDPRVRSAAFRSLRGFQDRKVKAILAKGLMDTAWQNRAEAAAALGRLGDPGTAEMLFQTLLDSDGYVRLQARRALHTLLTDANIAVYRRALGHSNREVRIAAAIALAEREDPAALTVLLGAIRNPDFTIRSAVLRGLAQVGDRHSIPLLRQALADASPEVRATATLALVEMGDTASTNQLAFLALYDPEERVRTAAIQALLFLNPVQVLQLPPAEPLPGANPSP